MKLYMIILSNTQNTTKASVYFETPKGLEILWNPVFSLDNKTFKEKAKALGFAVNTNYKNFTLPACYFKSSGIGFNRFNDIAEQAIETYVKILGIPEDKTIEVYSLEGYFPSFRATKSF